MRRAQADKADKGAKTPAGNKARTTEATTYNGYQRLSKRPLYFGSYGYDLPSFRPATRTRESWWKSLKWEMSGRYCFVLQFGPNACDNWRQLQFSGLDECTRYMHACLPTYVHLRTHALMCLRTSVRQYVQTEWKRHTCTYTYTHTHTHIYTYTHTQIHTHTHACMHAIHPSIHAYIHT